MIRLNLYYLIYPNYGDCNHFKITKTTENTFNSRPNSNHAIKYVPNVSHISLTILAMLSAAHHLRTRLSECVLPCCFIMTSSYMSPMKINFLSTSPYTHIGGSICVSLAQSQIESCVDVSIASQVAVQVARRLTRRQHVFTGVLGKCELRHRFSCRANMPCVKIQHTQQRLVAETPTSCDAENCGLSTATLTKLIRTAPHTDRADDRRLGCECLFFSDPSSCQKPHTHHTMNNCNRVHRALSWFPPQKSSESGQTRSISFLSIWARTEYCLARTYTHMHGGRTDFGCVT